MANNLDAYTKIDKEKRKKSPFFPNVEGCIDAFNQHLGSGVIPGTGLAEAVEDDVPVADDIFKAILNQFPSTDFPEKGASFILPSGKFLDPDKAHGEVDEFVVNNFPQIDLADYPNGYLVDGEQCVRLNDGRGKSFTFDRYITLPKYLTLDQIYAIEDWLKQYPYEEITIGDTMGHMALFSIEKDGISYIMNRIKKYKTTQILSEDTGSINEADELPNVSEDNIIGDEDAGISSMFIDAINDCWNSIDNYHSMIVTLDTLNRHEFDETLLGLLEERNKEVGALQGILEILTPASNQIEQGKEEAQDQVAFDEVPNDSINEAFVKEAYKYSIDDIEVGDYVVLNKEPRWSGRVRLIPVKVFSIGTFGKNTFSCGIEMRGEGDISNVVYVASSWEDANQWIENHKQYTSKELDAVIKNEDLDLFEQDSLHKDFTGMELTDKNILDWFQSNHPKYVKRLQKEFNLPLDSILNDQLTKQDIRSILQELKLVKGLCADFGITEAQFYSKF